MRGGLMLLLVSVAACSGVGTQRDSPREVRSLLGETLAPPELPPEREAALEADLAAARSAYEAAPDSEEAAIWVGRRLAYLGRYQEAVDCFSRGIERHPESYRLRRHRGHRRITLREFERAIADLTHASELMLAEADAIEPDGQPNAMGIPRSTDRFNIWYHLGLAHYLSGDYARAADAWRAGLEPSRANDDMLVATSYWLVLALARLGMTEEARALLGPIHEGMDVIENSSYLALLLHFRSDRPAEEFVEPADASPIDRATLSYGLGAWALAKGDRDRAEALFSSIVAGTTWASFGHIAAEADLARMRGIRPQSPSADAPPSH